MRSLEWSVRSGYDEFAFIVISSDGDEYRVVFHGGGINLYKRVNGTWAAIWSNH